MSSYVLQEQSRDPEAFSRKHNAQQSQQTYTKARLHRAQPCHRSRRSFRMPYAQAQERTIVVLTRADERKDNAELPSILRKASVALAVHLSRTPP